MQIGSRVEPALGEPLDRRPAAAGEEDDPVGAVDARRDRLDLLLDRRVERVEVRRTALGVSAASTTASASARRALAAALERRR